VIDFDGNHVDAPVDRSACVRQRSARPRWFGALAGMIDSSSPQPTPRRAALTKIKLHFGDEIVIADSATVARGWATTID
jgi:hypothetical protein